MADSILYVNVFVSRQHTWVNIQFKGHLVSFGYSERIYALCGSEFLKYCAMGNTIN